MYKILLQQFIKQFGRVPSALEKIFLKRQATQKALDQRKVLDMKGKPLDPNKPIIGGTQSEFQSGIIKTIKPKPTVVKQRGTHRGVGAGVQASGPSATRIKQGFSTQSKLNSWSQNQQWVKDFISRKNAEFNSLNRADQTKVLEMFEAQIKKHMPKEPLAGGGVAGMLGEPTYQEDNHRVPLKDAGFTGSPVYFQDKFDEFDWATRYNNMSPKEGWDQMIQDYINSTKMEEGELGKIPPIPLSVLRSGLGYILKQLAGGKFKEGRRNFLDFIVNPSKPTKLTNKLLYDRVKKKSDDLSKKIAEEMSKYSTKHADGGRVPLKGGKTPFKPPLPDENILEGIWKNMGPWEKVLWGMGLSPFEKGGRVDLAGGGLAAALRILMQKYGKDVIKLAKDVKPSKKWDTQKAIQAFKDRNPQFKNKRTTNVEGGRVGMLWGGGVWKKIIQNLAKAQGVTPSDYLKFTNWKSLPKEARNLMSKADFEGFKQRRVEMFENWVEMAKTRMNFLKNVKEGKKTPAAPIFEHLEKSFKSVVPGKVSQKDILQGEYILKNLKTKGQKLHASGGLAKMLGE